MQTCCSQSSVRLDVNMFCGLYIACLFLLTSTNALNEGESCMFDGIVGTCRDIRYCPSAVYVDLKGYIPRDPPLCSYKRNQPIVCCTDCQIMDVTKTVITLDGLQEKLGTNKSYDYCLDYLSRLPYSCKISVKITGFRRQLNRARGCHNLKLDKVVPLIGKLAKRAEFPHMALLGYGDKLESAEWSCGGSVISERFILTAGHCQGHSSLGPLSYVALGILRRSDPPNLWQRYRVKTFIPHPEYEYPLKYNDIALIETDSEIKFSSDVLPICLVDRELDAPEAQAEGWGAEGFNKPNSDGLRKAWLQKFSDEECSTLYPPYERQPNGIIPTQVCYGDHKDNKDTCQGDSGGPLQVWGGRSCVQYVVGVTSFGRACGFTGGAGVYTRVLPYLSWIEGHVWPN